MRVWVCDDCSKTVMECGCANPKYSMVDEAEKPIDDDLPDIIKERMKEDNLKISIRNKRKSIREMLRR